MKSIVTAIALLSLGSFTFANIQVFWTANGAIVDDDTRTGNPFPVVPGCHRRRSRRLEPDRPDRRRHRARHLHFHRPQHSRGDLRRQAEPNRILRSSWRSRWCPSERRRRRLHLHPRLQRRQSHRWQFLRANHTTWSDWRRHPARRQCPGPVRRRHHPRK